MIGMKKVREVSFKTSKADFFKLLINNNIIPIKEIVFKIINYPQ